MSNVFKKGKVPRPFERGLVGDKAKTRSLNASRAGAYGRQLFYGAAFRRLPGDRRRPPSVLTAFDLASYLAYRPFWTCSDGESPSHQSAPIARLLHSAASVLVITCRDSSSAAAVSFLRPCHPSRDTGLRRSTSVPAASARGARFARRFGGGTFLSNHVGHRRPFTVSWRDSIRLPA